MPQQQQYIAQSIQFPAHDSAGQSAKPHSKPGLAIDLIIIEAGLRLKVLPLRDAAIRGRQLRFSEAERSSRQRMLFGLCGNGPLRIIDIGLFADAVARRPGAAERLLKALRSNSQR